VPVWIIPIRDTWLAYARPMDALFLRADIDGRDSLDGCKTSNGVIHSFVCSLTCRHDRRMLYKTTPYSLYYARWHAALFSRRRLEGHG
jgi:hypothetical protein